jgi:ribosomal protein S12 methylthiotransferase accessory factor YcaO
LVRLYFEELVNGLAAAAPTQDAVTGPALAEHFERDLNRNLAVLFGRA